ncbi:MAG: hypothetical protein IJ141_04560 [Lachnospiraceae bacterium]|nr:hypothetical protein [Lachnospiraceae bacterium]
MVSLEFVFDEEKVKMAGYTTDDLLEPMRKHAAKYGIAEERYGYFTMDGKNAMAALSIYVMDTYRKNSGLIDYLTKFELTVGNEVDDCLYGFTKWKNRKMTKYA